MSAQEQSSFLKDTFKGVILDPSTYAPAAISYDATIRDWNTSQVFFQHGFFEHNERFTLTGRPNDVPMSYDAGRQRIRSDTLANLEMSLVNNVVDRLFEQSLIRQHPEHRTLIRTIGWIERLSFGAAMSYHLSAAHYRQAGDNELRARQMGLK